MTTRQTKKRDQSIQQQIAPLTLKDHLKELEIRLFAVGAAFVGVAAAAYPFFNRISHFITAPLNGKHELVYLTPGGAFSFIIKVCVYVGVIGALPVIIFNLYRFLMPAIKRSSMRTALFYTIMSLTLATGGMIFAYYVSLPASLYFLTGFSLQNINPMLTVDSYFSFVMTYVLAGALLFQLPLIMLIINTIKPLMPKKLMNYQRHIIVGSFIVAAIITPTPDPWNQTLLAIPVVAMYQLGIICVWIANRKKERKQKRLKVAVQQKRVVPEIAVKPQAASYQRAVPAQAITSDAPKALFFDVKPGGRRVATNPNSVRQNSHRQRPMTMHSASSAKPIMRQRVAPLVRVPARTMIESCSQTVRDYHLQSAPVAHTSGKQSLDGVILPRTAPSLQN